MWRLIVIIGLGVAAIGCTGGPTAQQTATLEQQQKYVAQIQEHQQRAASLDVNNRDLHARLAQSQQQIRVVQDEVSMLRKRLGETVSQLSESTSSLEHAEGRAKVMEASSKRRGGATITANNSMQDSIEAIEIPGIVVRVEAGGVRIELPADRLFLPKSATLHRDAFPLIDQVAAAVKQSYPRQTISVEGHTDTDQVNGQFRGGHQLSIAQATVVYEQLAMRHQFPVGRMKVAGHGPNLPVVSNGTEQGKTRNRRIELVILPADG
jgi:chemotaxis protein MotB